MLIFVCVKLYHYELKNNGICFSLFKNSLGVSFLSAVVDV